ncbi:acyltransferase family protein [Paenibacillus sp. NEAU-GSW1]|uniref:acyltransferase family protein n=1 Tax=Paenibacillus sp. NEAU-GSW1 TaxID=2682486 RepID=UPI001C12A9B1
MKGRLYALDYLRAFLTILVIFHHTAITYGAEGGWYYIEAAGDELTATKVVLTLFTGVNQAFFMGLFFFISGYFTPGSFDKKGPAKFMLDRLIRLGIPLLVYTAIIGPAIIYALSYADELSVWQFYKEQVLSFKLINVGPLWFAEALLLFAAAYALIRMVAKQSVPLVWNKPFPGRKSLLLSILFVGLSAFIIRLFYPTGEDWLGLQFGYFASYIFLYGAGIAAHRNRWLEQIAASTSKKWLWVSLSVFPLMPIAALLAESAGNGDGLNGGIHLSAIIYAMWEPFIACGIILGLLVWFREKLNRPNRMLQLLADHAFTVFIIHPPIVVGISFWMKNLEWPMLLKFIAVGLLATASCYLLALLIRRIPRVRRIL